MSIPHRVIDGLAQFENLCVVAMLNGVGCVRGKYATVGCGLCEGVGCGLCEGEVCVRVCLHACVSVCVCVCVSARVCARVNGVAQFQNVCCVCVSLFTLCDGVNCVRR